MARRRTGKVFTRGPRNYIWTAARIEIDVNTGATPLRATLVQSTDWTQAVGFRRATLLGIRGWLSWRALTASASGDARAIIMKDATEAAVTAQDPNVITTYVDEDILWTGGYSGPPGSTSYGFNEVINVKAKRKITVDDTIRFVVSESLIASPNATRVAGVLRCLLNLSH